MTSTPQMTEDDAWVEQYASMERRRNIAIGLAIFMAVALVSIAIITYFGSAAAIAW